MDFIESKNICQFDWTEKYGVKTPFRSGLPECENCEVMRPISVYLWRGHVILLDSMVILFYLMAWSCYPD